jgi:hypothetical protein
VKEYGVRRRFNDDILLYCGRASATLALVEESIIDVEVTGVFRGITVAEVYWE